MPFKSRGDTLRRRDYMQERGFEPLGMINCGKVNKWGKLMLDKGYSVKFIYRDLPRSCLRFC